jgi:uncharacterized protein (TIGR02145 family)
MLIRHIIIVLVLISLYSNGQSFICGSDSVVDIDGNVYQTVTIGDKCWMKSNMNTTRYANGTPVDVSEINGSGIFYDIINQPGNLQFSIVSNSSENLHMAIYTINGSLVYQNDFNNQSPKIRFNIRLGPPGCYIVKVNEHSLKGIGLDHNSLAVQVDCESVVNKSAIDSIVITDDSRNYFDYNDDPANGLTYGKLYTLLSALNIQPSQKVTAYPSKIQGVCPDHWHVASDNDWLSLEIFAGLSQGQASEMFKYRGTVSKKLKSTGNEYWFVGDGTDDFGFSAKGSGYYYCDEYEGCFYNSLKSFGTWWTYNQDNIMKRQISDFQAGIWRSYYVTQSSAYAVRCVLD